MSPLYHGVLQLVPLSVSRGLMHLAATFEAQAG
jgi:hypothetical protein